LKEEHFRKQMQSKFAANLKKLVNLLQSWEAKENFTFDESLLSDDVRDLLKEDPDQMENWIQKRTKLMALRTVKSQTPRKRALDDSDPKTQGHAKKISSRHVSSLTPAIKISVSNSKKRYRIDQENELSKKKQCGLPSRHQEANGLPQSSPKKRDQRKGTPLKPFGNIFSEADKNDVPANISKGLVLRDDNKIRRSSQLSPPSTEKKKSKKVQATILPFGDIL
jgi:hypothetical protein